MKFSLGPHLNYKPLSRAGKKDIQKSLDNFYSLFSKYATLNDWVIDIGPNAGDSSLVLGTIVGPAGKVICFEPDKVAYDQLNKNIKANGFSDRFETFNVAAGNKNEKVPFVCSSSHDNGGLMEDFSTEERGTGEANTEVQMIDLESFLRYRYIRHQLGRISLIKIDTEGYDYVILNNLKSLLREFDPIVIMEWWFHESKNGHIFEAIRNVGYMPYRSDNFLPVEEEHFHNRCSDLILMPNPV